MELKVLKEFCDKETDVIYQPGSYFTVGEKKRSDDLVKLGFLKGDKQKPKEVK